MRAAHPALQATEHRSGEAWPAGDTGIVMRRSGEAESFLVIASFRGNGTVHFGDYLPEGGRREVVLTTEDAPFAPDPLLPEITPSTVTFQRAGAVVLRTSHR